MRDLARLQRLMADALVDPEPDTALRAADPAFADTDPDGVRIAALLIVRLRFERVIHGSRQGGEWFDEDPAAFAAAFKRYHAEVPPTAATPSGEARLFEAWVEAVTGT
ncbi:MAG: hypothetical protein O2816_06310 [Planctomycetota bacterium]|nr:hypothetical protein [Planctomycetota bacterium]